MEYPKGYSTVSKKILFYPKYIQKDTKKDTFYPKRYLKGYPKG
jgi:hypothetical protein